MGFFNRYFHPKSLILYIDGPLGSMPKTITIYQDTKTLVLREQDNLWYIQVPDPSSLQNRGAA